MDKLSEVLNHLSVSAGVFYTGNLCGSYDFEADSFEGGHLHFLESGKATLSLPNGKRQLIDEPAMIYFPRPANYRFAANKADNAQVVCANVKYGTEARSPLANTLPPLMIIKLSEVESLQSVKTLLLDEAFHQYNGRAAIMDRLIEILVIAILRHTIDTGLIDQGMLAGLAHPQLSRAIMAIHEAPNKNWSLAGLAEISAMSRAKFAKLFNEYVGQPAGDYILEWRVAIAQSYLKRGKDVGWVANKVGYETSSAFSRAFRKKTSCSPKEWLKLQVPASI